MTVTIPADQVPPLVERMIRIEAKLDTFNANHQDHEGRIRVTESQQATMSGQLASLDGRLASGASTFADHETRLRGLERRMWITAGVALLGGGVMGAVIGPLLGVGG